MLVPTEYVTPPNIDDLMLWNCNACSCWGVDISYHPTPSVDISPPLDGDSSETLSKGEQLIFAREFEGRVGDKRYFEMLQKFLHISDLHYLAERNAYCRLDRHGDVDDVIRIIEIPVEAGQMFGGTIVAVTREVLDRYATLTGSTIVRTFDFTRVCLSRFGGWRDSHDAAVTQMGDLFFRTHIETGYASYIRGCQVIPSQASKEEIMEEFRPGSGRNEQYASFIAHDWKIVDARIAHAIHAAIVFHEIVRSHAGDVSSNRKLVIAFNFPLHMATGDLILSGRPSLCGKGLAAHPSVDGVEDAQSMDIRHAANGDRIADG
jgi:hypothetical protein